MTLNLFSLPLKRSEVKNFLEFGIRRKVKHLDLDFSNPSWKSGTKDGLGSTFMQLPSYDEGHEKLESLRLFSCYMDVKKFTSFSSLKTISQGWIPLDKGCLIQMLISKCPSLESLSLINVYNTGGMLKVFSPTLNKLVVENCHSLLCIILDAPCLKSFEYSGELIAFFNGSVNEIKEVVLDFGQQEECDAYLDDGLFCLYYLLTDFRRTRVLTICSYMLQALSDHENLAINELPLANVQHLTINCGSDIKEYNGISFFLHSCTSLEVLTINIGIARVIKNEDYEEVPSSLPENHPFLNPCGSVESHEDCLKDTLKVIVVNGFKGSMNEYLVLQYMCKYGK